MAPFDRLDQLELLDPEPGEMPEILDLIEGFSTSSSALLALVERYAGSGAEGITAAVAFVLAGWSDKDAPASARITREFLKRMNCAESFHTLSNLLTAVQRQIVGGGGAEVRRGSKEVLSLLEASLGFEGPRASAVQFAATQVLSELVAIGALSEMFTASERSSLKRRLAALAATESVLLKDGLEDIREFWGE
jgi:hypothetical protein